MSSFMTPSPWLYSFLEAQERFRPTAYKPTPRDVWTIGYGHTEDVQTGDTCDLAQAKAWLQQDATTAVRAVNQHVTVPLSQQQFDALCSLVFNIGAGNFEESTLLHHLNDHHYEAAASEFLRWDHQGGAVLAGLRDRRKAERDHFLS